MKIGIDFDRVLSRLIGSKIIFSTDLRRLRKPMRTQYRMVSTAHKDMRSSWILLSKKYSTNLRTLQNFFMKMLVDSRKLQESFEVVIVSRGDPVFQREKIIDSGVKEYVDDFHIVQDKPKDTIDIDFLVDDLKQEIQRTDIPGFIFDREKHSVDDIIKKVRKLDG